MPNIRIVLLLLMSFYGVQIIAQNSTSINGTITDKKGDSPMAFATISWTKVNEGTTANQLGEFSIRKSASEDDTLQISFIGYTSVRIPANSIDAVLNIKMESNSFDLNEVVIRPKPPTYYIKLAVKKMKENYPDQPFETEGYFSEKALENGKFIGYKESVFKTYYPSFQDTVKNQNQLLLFRNDKKIHEVAFMEKQRKKEEKKGKKESSINVATDSDTTELFDFKSIFSGPDLALAIAKIDSNEIYLDSNNFSKMEYTFGAPTTYDNKSVMVIHFKSKRKVENVKVEGTLFIDEESDAIVSLDYEGVIKIPAMIKPILFLVGLGIKNPTIKVKSNYKEIDGHYYPNNAQAYIDLILTKRYMFKKNEKSKFEFFQLFSVNKFNLNDANPIPTEKLFKSNEDYSKQVFNDNGITWDDINVIKR